MKAVAGGNCFGKVSGCEEVRVGCKEVEEERIWAKEAGKITE